MKVSAVKIHVLADCPFVPWRNGGGRTRELLAWPDAHDWQLRVSVADIEADGPFSTFAGVERWFAVLQGQGVELSVGAAQHRLARGDAPLRFDGATPAACLLLDGPTRDLNLMLRRATGSMQPAVDAQDWSPGAAQCGLFSAVTGRCQSDTFDVAVPAYSLAWFAQAPQRLRFVAEQRPAARVGWWLAATPQESDA